MLIANDSMVPGIKTNTLSRLDGIVLLVLFLGYMCWVVVQKGKDPKKALEEADEEASTSLAGKNPWLLWGIALVSLVALIWGGNLFLDSAKNLARAWGMSEAVIAITIVAVGTSLPELVTGQCHWQQPVQPDVHSGFCCGNQAVGVCGHQHLGLLCDAVIGSIPLCSDLHVQEEQV